MEIVSKEYEEFLKKKRELKLISIYEKACKFSEKVLPINPTKGMEEKLKDAIEFAHLEVTPLGSFSLAFFFSALIFLIPLSTLIILDSFSLTSLVLLVIVSVAVFYYLLDYPLHYATVFRIKASSEMVLAIVYMSISMRLTPNIENAIEFASKNLRGPLALDLKKLLWDIYAGRYVSVDRALEDFIKKWRRENEEFTEAIYMIKSSLAETQERRERMLDEAVSIAINGTKERMRHYAQDLKTPLTILNSMGILLPIVGLVFFPVVALFLPELVKPIFLVIGYNLFLPLSVYFLMKSYLEKRPYSFHQPDVSRHPEFAKEIFLEKPYIPLALSLFLVFSGTYNLRLSEEMFGISLLVNSLLIILGIAIGIIIYSFLSVRRRLKLREEIFRIESEFSEALFQLGNMLSRNIPLETSLKRVTENIRNLKIARFFERILYNIEVFGMTFEQAIFDKKFGAINFYPSGLIEAVMRAISETSKKGIGFATKAMLSVSTYLKDMHSVEEELRSLLEEVTSTMKVQAMMLAPISAGVVVALAAIMTEILFTLQISLERIYGQLFLSLGPLASLGGGMLSSVVNLNQIIPPHAFQLIVGIYMVEVVTMLSIFLSVITNGEESLLKRFTLAKLLLVATIVYSIIMFFTYLGFVSLIPLTGLIA